MNYSERQVNPTTNSSGVDGCRDSAEVSGLVTVFCALIVIIVVSNTVIIVTFAMNRKLHTATNMFFVSLAVSDILVGAVSVPMWIVILIYPLYNSCIAPSTMFFRIYKFLDIFSALASTAHLMAISFERSLAISQPILHRTCPRYYFHIMIGIAWFYGLLASVIFMFDFTPNWQKYRAIVVFFVGFVLPLVVIMILYALTFRSVKQYVKRRRNNSACNYQKYITREKRTAKTVGIVLAVFIIAWLPFFIVSLMIPLCGLTCMNTRMNTLLVDFVKILHFANSAVNPYVYTFRNETWKRIVLKTTLPCGVFKQKRMQWTGKKTSTNTKLKNPDARSSDKKTARQGQILLQNVTGTQSTM